jgi:hypothetical protein
LELEDEAAMRVDMAGAWLAAKPLPCFCEQRFEPPASGQIIEADPLRSTWPQ